MSLKGWILIRKDRGPEGVEFEVFDSSNQTLVCSRITNRREADMLRASKEMLVVLKAVKPILAVSKDPTAKQILHDLEDVILKASVILVTIQCWAGFCDFSH